MGRAKLTIAIALVASLAHAQVQVWNQDLNGSTNANKIVTGLKNNQLPSLTTGFLNWNGTAWALSTIIANGPGTAGQFLVTNAGATAPVWVSLSTDIAGSTSTPGSLSVQSITPTGGTSTIVPFNAGGFKLATMPWVLQDPSGTPVWNTTANSSTFGGGVGTGPLVIDWSTATTPFIQSGTSATQLTVGPNKAGAGLLLNTDANSPIVGLYGGTQNGYALGTHPAASGHMRGESGFIWNDRNSANTADQVVILDDGANDLYMGDSNWNNVTIRAGNQAELVAGNTVYVQAYATGGALYLGPSAGTSTIVLLDNTNVAQVTAPASPAAGSVNFYVDSADGKLKAKDPAGNIFTLAP